MRTIKLHEIETKKEEFHGANKPVSILDVDVNKITISESIQARKGLECWIGWCKAINTKMSG